MPDLDSAENLVARYLKYNNYDNTLDAFLREANLPLDAGVTARDSLTLERLIDEKRRYDLSLSYEKRTPDENKGWTRPAPSVPQQQDIPNPTNVLHVSVDTISPLEDGGDARRQQQLVVTTSDRSLHRASIDQLGYATQVSSSCLLDSPILSWSALGNDRLSVGTSMSGKVIVHDDAATRAVLQIHDHKKYVVKAASLAAGGVFWVATIGWDKKLLLYHLTGRAIAEAPAPEDGEPLPEIGPPTATQTLPSNPEDILWIREPETKRPILILTRRDSTSLYFYTIDLAYDPSATAAEECSSTHPLTYLGSQNLSPYSSAWNPFTASSIAISPIDPTLLAVATSSMPHLKLILVHLLIPGSDATVAREEDTAAVPPSTPFPIPDIQDTLLTPNPAAARAQAQLARQHREEAAISHFVSTMAPQTPYSTPKVVWRPDGSGVWVNGDDGIVRGVEGRSGKIVASLADGGHEPGSKVRALWAGNVSVNGGQEEWLVSGGFDRKVIVWKVPDQQH